MIGGLAVKALSIYGSAEMVGLVLDYTSIARWAYRITKTASKMQSRAHRIDERMLDEMVAEAQSRVPRRSGKLAAGITGEREGNVLVFKAEAQRDEDSADYAPFVERGTRAGSRGQAVASPTFYESGRPPRRKSRRTHPGTPAQPFFYPAARLVLERRRAAQSQALLAAASSDNEG